MNSPQLTSGHAPLKDQLRSLEQIQEVDLKIDQVKKKKAIFPQTEKTLEDTIKRAEKEAGAKQSAIDELEKVQRQTQAALDLNQDRLKRSSSRLEVVQNSTEYQAVTKEVEQLKKMNTQLEEQIAKSRADIEALRKELQSIQEKNEKARASATAELDKIRSETSVLDGQIETLESERGQFLGGLDRRLLSQYDRVRVARGGLGIVPAVAGRCKGCNMMVPPQLYNEIQKCTAIHACPSCSRILFAPGSNPSAG